MKAKSIDEALDILDDYAQQRSDEIRDRIANRYSHLQATLSEAAPIIKNSARNFAKASKEGFNKAKGNVVDFTTKTAKTVDKSAHNNPWTFLACGAAASLILGFVLGKKYDTRK